MRPTASHDVTSLRIDRALTVGEARLRVFAGSALLVTVGVIASGLTSGPLVDWKALLILAALLVCAEHRDRLFGDQTSASGSIVVAMAAVVAFSSGPWLAGPMLCSGLAGAYWPHLRNRAWSRVAVNTSSMSLAGGASATCFHFLGAGAREVGAVAAVAGLVAVLAFWIVNSLVLGVAVALIQRRGLWAVCRGLLASDTELLGFAYGGFFAGFVFADASTWAGVLVVALLLVLLDLLVTGRLGRDSQLRHLAAPGIEALAVLMSLVWLGLDHALPSSEVLFALVGLGLTASVAAIRRREEFLRFAALLAVTAAVVSPGIRESFFAPIVVSLAVCLVPIWRRQTSWSRLSLVGAAGLAAISAVAAIEVLPQGVLTTLPGSVLAGATGGLAAVAAWHAILGLNLLLKVGPGGLPAVGGIVRDEIAFGLGTGICGAVCGWIGTRWGVAALTVSFAAVLAVAWVLIGRPKSTEELGQSSLGDDELVDVLRSAVLDIPASRPPD